MSLNRSLALIIVNMVLAYCILCCKYWILPTLKKQTNCQVITMMINNIQSTMGKLRSQEKKYTTLLNSDDNGTVELKDPSVLNTNN